jgi:hypothetical protein
MADFKIRIIGRLELFLIVSIFLITCSYVTGSYFIDIPEKQLFTPPNGYIFAVNLNQFVTFDVTGKEMIKPFFR